MDYCSKGQHCSLFKLDILLPCGLQVLYGGKFLLSKILVVVSYRYCIIYPGVHDIWCTHYVFEVIFSDIDVNEMILFYRYNFKSSSVL